MIEKKIDKICDEINKTCQKNHEVTNRMVNDLREIRYNMNLTNRNIRKIPMYFVWSFVIGFIVFTILTI